MNIDLEKRNIVLKKYNESGIKTIPELMKLTGFSRDLVVDTLDTEKLEYILTKKRYIANKIGNNQIQCRTCKEVKEFKKFRKLKYGFSAECMVCKQKKDRNRKYSLIEKLLMNRVCILKSRAKLRNLNIDIDANYLVELFNKFNGKCFYTNEIMNWQEGIKKLDADTLTIDKIIPELGYIKGNVVLCTNKANHSKSFLTLDEMKKWTPLWYKKAIKHLQENNIPTTANSSQI